MSRVRKPGPLKATCSCHRGNTVACCDDYASWNTEPIYICDLGNWSIKDTKRLHAWLGKAIAWLEQKERSGK